jgi:hypothetical protein
MTPVYVVEKHTLREMLAREVKGARILVVNATEQPADLAQQLAGRDVVVAGGDALVARLATAVYRDVPTQRTRFAVVGVGVFDDTARFSHIMQARKALERGRVEEETVATLRLVSSSLAQPTLAFQVGFGTVARLAESWLRHGRLAGTARAAMDSSSAHDEVEFVLNRKSVEKAAYLQVCGLPSGWLKMTAGLAPTMRFGRTPSDLLRELPSRRLQRLSRLMSGDADTFDVVHIRAHSGYVVDGEVFPDSVTETLEVKPGPRVTLLKG